MQPRQASHRKISDISLVRCLHSDKFWQLRALKLKPHQTRGLQLVFCVKLQICCEEVRRHTLPIHINRQPRFN